MNENEPGMEVFKSKQRLPKTPLSSPPVKPCLEDCSLTFASGPRKRDGLVPQPAHTRQRQQRNGFKISRQKQQIGKRGISSGPCAASELEDMQAAATAVRQTQKNKPRPCISRSGNDLLNFNYVSSKARGTSEIPHNRRYRHGSTSYSKEVFLQANCRFVVKADEDYSRHAVDPDMLVNWDWIERVFLSGRDVPTCPICLFPPTVARITRCGHVYCWACITHYLHLGTKNHRKCPICHDDVHASDLRSVTAESCQTYAHGDKITMTLMRREKGSTVAQPMSAEIDQCTPSASVDCKFAKLMPATFQYVLQDIVQPELQMLNIQKIDAISEQSGEEAFIELALAALQQKKNQLEQLIEEHGTSSNAAMVLGEMNHGLTDLGDATQQIINAEGDDVPSIESCRPWRVSCSSDDSVPQSPIDGTYNATQPTFHSNSLYATGDKAYYYFYQASDGQNIFIHPVNVRCLVKEYGSLEACPVSISASIIATETVAITQETRKKYRYLCHLPITCEFKICELMLKAPDVSKETLACFAEEFRKRKQQRQQRKREEKKSERKYEASQRYDSHGRALKAPARDMYVAVDSLTEFPMQFAENSPTVNPDEDNIPDWVDLAFSSTAASAPSFAQTLGKSVASPLAWTSSVKKKSIQANTEEAGSDKDDEEKAVPSFADAFSLALALSTPTGDAAESVSSPSSRGNKKQRKRGKQVLFSTGSTRKY